FGFSTKSGVYLITSVVDGLSDSPIVFTGKVYRNMGDGDMLPLGHPSEPTAVFNVYYRNKPLPDVLSFAVLVLRSNADLREIGTVMSKVRDDAHFKTLSTTVQSVVAAANPAYGVIWQVTQDVISLFAGYLGSKPDDQLGYYQANFTNLF